MDSTNYREFSSFYAMKEWLKQGEFVLPAVYKTLNDGKYYFDDAVDVSGIEDMIPYMFDNGLGIQGITFNNNHEVSRVLCQYMDSHFMNASETFIKINKDIIVQEDDFEKSDSSNSITLGLFNEDNGPEIAFELDIEVDTHNGATVNEQYRFTLSYGEPSVQGLLSVNCEWYDNQIEVYVTTVDGGSWTGSINAKKYKKEEHFSNIGAFNMGFSYDMKMFENFKHYGSLKEKVNQKYHNMILPKQFVGSDITGIVIPEGVEYIGTKAFYHCDSLEYVKLPSTLKCIGRAAFQSCKSLKEIYIPENCEVIENAAFMSCGQLKKVTIANGVKKILNNAFAYTGIERLFLPNSVTTVLSKSFAYCLNLKHVYIGANVNSRSGNDCGDRSTTMNGMAFYHSPIEKFYVDERNENVKVGCNGELMIKHNKSGEWMIIKVPYSYKGMYVADPTAVSMIRNLFDYGHNVPYQSGYIYNNIGDRLTGINFNNIKSVPKCLCANNTNIETIEMPHVHKIHHSAFNTKSVQNITIGSIDDEDIFLPNHCISTINKCGKEPNLFFSSDLTITLNVGDKSLYENDTFWRKYYNLPICNIEIGSQWKESNKVNPSPNNYLGPYESFSNKGLSEASGSVANMKVKLLGYENFDVYIRSSGESSYDYTIASNPNEEITVSNYGSSAFVTTKSKQNSGTSLSSYTLASYSNLDITTLNYITISYRKDYSVDKGDDCGYALIPIMDRGIYSVVDTSRPHFGIDTFPASSGYAKYTSLLMSEGYSKIRIYFKGITEFELRIVSEGGGILCVPHLDRDLSNIVEQSLEQDDFQYLNFDWVYTTQYSYNNGGLGTDISQYRRLFFKNDGGLHFIEVYLIRDSSKTSGMGYILLPQKQK